MATKQELIELGRKEVRDGLYQSALGYFEQAASKDPSDADAHYYVAGAHFKLGDARAAGKAAKKALFLKPEHARARALLEKLKEGDSKGESTLPRQTGYLALGFVLLTFAGVYLLLFLNVEPLTERYGNVLSNVYHSMDVEDPITDRWQPWRFVTGFLVVVMVLGNVVFPSYLVSYLISCPLYAIRHNLWRFDLGVSHGLGTGAAVLVIACLVPPMGLLVWILTRLWGVKILILAAVVALLGIYQLVELAEQKEIRSRKT